MPEKTVAQKLLLKPGMTASLGHVPDSLRDALRIPEDVTLRNDPDSADFLLDLASSQTEAEERLRAMEPRVRDKVVAWVAYPKGSRAAGYDVNRDTIATFVRTIGLVAVAAVAIDDTLSALRVRRL